MSTVFAVSQRLVHIILAAALALLMFSASALPARAMGVGPFTSSACPANNMCLWSGAVYTGSFFSTVASTDISTFSVAKAVWNRTSRAVRVYSNAGGGGSSICFAPGTQVASTTLAARSVVVLSATVC